MLMRDRGEHLGIYHIGTTEEVTIAELARRMARLPAARSCCGLGRLPEGSTPRRCPDISKLAALGYKPRVSLDAVAADAATGTGSNRCARRQRRLPL